MKFQMSGVNKSYDELYTDLINGKENDLRTQAASETDYQNATERNSKIVQLAAVGNLTPETIPPPAPRANPDSIFEEKYSKEYMKYYENAAAKQTQSSFDWQSSWLAGAAYETPQQLERAKNVGSEVITKREFALKTVQDAEDEVARQGWVPWGLDQAKMLVPFYNDYTMRGLVKGIPPLKGFLGTNIEDQIVELLGKPVPEFKKQFTEIMKDLTARNPSQAKAFAMAVVGQSTNDISLNNLFNVIDMTALSGVAKTPALLKKISLYNKTQTAVRDLVKSIEGPEAGRVLQAAGAGDAGEVAVLKTTDDVVKGMKGTGNPSKEAIESMTSNLQTDIAEIAAGPSRRFGQEGVNRLKEQFSTSMGNLQNSIFNIMRLERIPGPVAAEKAIREYQTEIRSYYPGQRNNIMDVSRPYKVLDNWFSDVIMGNKGDELFTSKEVAQNWAELNRFVGAKIEDKGAGYQVVLTRPVKETDAIIRDALYATAESKEPVSLWNAFLGKFRNPDDVLSADAMINRKLATYAPAVFLKMAREEAASLIKLARGSFRRQTVDILDAKGNVVGQRRMSTGERYQDLERIIKSGRDMLDPEFPDVKNRGYFFRSPRELEDQYMRVVNRMPEQDEIEGYFAFKRLNEMDRVYRNLQVYKNKTRVGAELHSFYTLNEGGGRVKGPMFEGMKLNHMPRGDENILIVGKHTQDAQVKDLSSLGGKIEEYDKAIKEGRLSVVEIGAPETNPLAQWGDKIGNTRVRYVLTDNLETGPLSYNQVPRRGGGHFEYDYEHYIKQAKVRVENQATGAPAFRHWYEGDTTVMPMQLRSLGVKMADRLNNVRELLQAEKIDEAKAFATSSGGLPIEWKELHSWFKPSVAPDGITKVPPRLSLEEPFYVVPRDKLIIDIDKSLEHRYPGSTFKDGTRTGSAFAQHQTQFTGARDAFEVMTIQDVGTRHNPLFSYEPAKMVDAMTTMNRGLTRIINSSLMDDYKIFSVEHWLQKNKDLLKASDSEIRYAPFYYFNNAPNAFKTGADAEEVARAKVTHFQIQQLVGVKSTMDTLLHSYANKLAEEVYSRIGPGKIVDKLASADQLSIVKDPISFARGIAFHAKLGLLSIPQMLVQAQTFATIYGIAGAKAAGQGTIAAALHTFSRINKNPEILKHLDKIASKMGWKPGEFLEARELMERTGFGHVGGEYAGLDNALNPRVVNTRGKDFLDAGTFFFREGEQAARTGAFYTAYKEFRTRVPTGPLSETDKRAILNRADLLNVNMSRASSSQLHTGVFSLPTQFLSYQIRSAELFVGKRLTPEQKMRLFYTHALLYGAPTAIGVTGIPLGDLLRKTAIENGYVVGDNYIESLMAEGLPSMMLSAVTGKHWNVGTRLGNQGFETIKEAMTGDKGMWDIIGGAAFSTLKGTFQSSNGFLSAMMSAISGDQQAFPIKPADIVDVFKEVSSVNNTWKMLAALNSAKWFTKKETFQAGEVSPMDAVFSYLTGLTYQSATDANLKSLSIKSKEEFVKDQTNKFVKEFRRGLDAQENNPEQAKDYFTRAFTYLEVGGFPEEKRAMALSLASQGKESLIDRVNWNFYLENVPDAQKQSRREAYKKILKQGHN
jgi:hypothetical protein